MLSCEIYKLFKNNYFEEHLWTSPSKHYLKRASNTGASLCILGIIQENLFFQKHLRGVFSLIELQAWLPETFNSPRKRLSHCHFSVNFEKFLGKLCSGTPPSNRFLDDIAFFFFADQWALQAKINLPGGAMVN